MDRFDQSETYNQRQYKLMLRTIQQYREGRIKFGSLVSDIDGLIYALENPARNVFKKLQSYWGRLEDTYALMMDQARTELSDSDIAFVSETLQELESLVETQL